MRVLSYLIIVFLAPTIILLNFRLLVFNHNYYQKEFEKHGVYSQVGENTTILESKSLIDYLCCDGQPDKEFFAEREVLHLADVKTLIRQAQILLVLNLGLLSAVSIVLLVKSKVKFLLAGLGIGSQVGIAAILTLAIFSAVDFDFLFQNFHLVSFDNDLWQLPSESNLTNLFPQGFFRDFANRVALQSAAMLLAIYILPKYLLKKR